MIVVTKVLQIIEAGCQITVVALDENRSRLDVANAVAQGVFIAAQAGDIHTRHYSKTASANTKYNWAVGAGTADLTRTGVGIAAKVKKKKQKGETFTKLEIAGEVINGVSTVALRLADVADAAKPTKDCPKHQKLCEDIHNKMGNVSVAANITGSVLKITVDGPRAWHAVQQYRQRRAQRRRLLQAGGGGGAGGAGVQLQPLQQPAAAPAAQPAAPNAFANDPAARQQQDEMARRVQRMFDALTDLSQLKEIDEIFHDDLRLGHRCKISGKPIRFIVGPNIPADEMSDEEDVIYEQGALQTWIATKPNEAPPGWPIGKLPLPLSIHSWKAHRERQRDINKSLRESIEELRKEYGA